MRGKAGQRVAKKLAWRIGLESALIFLSALCGCSLKDVFPSHPATLSNAEAVDRALQLCSLTAGDQPFHLLLETLPPVNSQDPASGRMQARIEIYWLNSITFRTNIRSAGFSQTRIVNGRVVEEHNTGDFYPRWIENFVQAILEPIPRADLLRKVSGSVPVGVEEHACISSGSAQVCFQDAEPRIATGSDAVRTVWFENYMPFGRQQIARTLVDKLPGNLLVRGRIVLLTPLDRADYPLLKAREFTPESKLVETKLLSQAAADALLQDSAADFPKTFDRAAQKLDRAKITLQPGADAGDGGNRVYIRTDRIGRVREAYRERAVGGPAPDIAEARALTLRFKPLIVEGAPRQMEAVIGLP
jgi:hypothetical protein